MASNLLILLRINVKSVDKFGWGLSHDVQGPVPSRPNMEPPLGRKIFLKNCYDN